MIENLFLPLIICSDPEDRDFLKSDLAEELKNCEVPNEIGILDVSINDHTPTQSILRQMMEENNDEDEDSDDGFCSSYLIKVDVEVESSIRNMPLYWLDTHFDRYLRNLRFFTCGLYVFYHTCPESLSIISAMKINDEDDERYLSDPNDDFSYLMQRSPFLHHCYYGAHEKIDDDMVDQVAKQMLLCGAENIYPEVDV